MRAGPPAVSRHNSVTQFTTPGWDLARTEASIPQGERSSKLCHLERSKERTESKDLPARGSEPFVPWAPAVWLEGCLPAAGRSSVTLRSG